jgi:thermitase
MSRQYYQRGHLVEAEELDGVVAVRMGTAAPEAEAELGSSAFGEIHAAGIDDETTGAFARASWVFVRPNEQTREAFATGGEIPGAAAAGKVIRRPTAGSASRPTR